MIQSFRDKETRRINDRIRSSGLPNDIQQIVYRKLRMINNAQNLNDLRIKLGRMGIMNMLVEGGGGVLTSFLKQRQADKIVVCVAPMIIGKGIDAIGDLGIRRLDNAVRLDGVEFTKSGPDCIMSGYPVWR